MVRVLVTFSSPNGSTRSIAERIAARLRDGGFLVDRVPVDEAPTVANYDAVVIGSAIHGQAWTPEATRFLTTHEVELAARSVWLFSVGMPDALARPFRRFAKREGPRAVAPFMELLRPRGTHLFSGVVEKAQFPLVSRAVMRLLGARFGDFRDWHDVDKWAARISRDLHESKPPTSEPGHSTG